MRIFNGFAAKPLDAPLPIVATIPKSGTWFLRYAISFFCHLERGERIDDRIKGRILGNSSGKPFDFERFRGGPLFCVRSALPFERMFIGHTVCPGFRRLAEQPTWWTETNFHTQGYDYLHAGLNYQYTPVELAPEEYTPLSPEDLDDLPWSTEHQRMVLVYREPVAQAASYFHHCQGHSDPIHRFWGDRALVEVPFREFLFEAALPSYAKQFASFQLMALRLPDQVKLVPYETLIGDPVRTLSEILSFLSGGAHLVDKTYLGLAVQLARQEHLQAIERELGRSLDGSREGSGSHIQQRIGSENSRYSFDARLYEGVAKWLGAKSIDPAYFVWPATSQRERTSTSRKSAAGRVAR